MRVRSLAALAAVLLAAGCGGAFAPQAARGTAEACVPLFQEFDRLEDWYGAGPRFDDNLVEVPALQAQGMRLLRADCITRAGDLDRSVGAPRDRVLESGAPIRPIALHAGAVAGIMEEIRARTYFVERGVRVRSVGHASLGRRIYLGPFRTEGGIAAAAEAARQAGFVAPYPARF